MVLAAGLGTRMRPLTDRIPKPLVPVSGKPLIDHVLDRLADAGVARAVVNVHYMAEQIEQHLAYRTRPQIVISDERGLLLGTGGGVARALPQLGQAPFFHINSEPSGSTAYSPTSRASPKPLTRHNGRVAVARADRGQHRLCRTRRFRHGGGWPLAKTRRARGFAVRLRRRCNSFARAVYRRAIRGILAYDAIRSCGRAGRLHGLRLEGLWMHVGTPESVAAAEAAIKASASSPSSRPSVREPDPYAAACERHGV